MDMMSSLPVSATSHSSGWFIDTRNHRIAAGDSESEIDKISRRNREQAAADAKRAAQHREEREQLAQQRRLQAFAVKENRADTPSLTKRIFEIEGRVKKLEAEVLANRNDDKTRTELTLARAQLFWTKNTKTP